MSGTAVVSGPNATLSATSLTFAAQLTGTTSPAQSITLKNYGTAALSITGIGFTGADPSDFAQANTCGHSVAAGASCTIHVTFKPLGINERTASLSITDNASGGSPQTISLSGAGTVVELNSDGLDFGFVPFGQRRSRSITLTNVGSTTLTINSVRITAIGPDSGSFSQRNTCSSSVGPGQSCTITVTFISPGMILCRGKLDVSDNGGASPQSVFLLGSGYL